MLNSGPMKEDAELEHKVKELGEPPVEGDKTGGSGPAGDPGNPTRQFNPWALVIYIGIVAAFAVAGAYIGYLIAHYPILDIEEAVSNYQQNVNTVIFDGTGEGKIEELAEERRVLMSYDRIPQHFINALIIAEDKEFLRHQGVDVPGIMRAFLTNLSHGRVVQGGSTITQQLIKNLFLSPEQTYTRKIKEAVLALQLEAKYTKDEILGFYCNTVYFGHQRYGLEAAARYYFGINASELDLTQSVMLAGLIRAPERYTPFRHPDRALQRRNYLLGRMAASGVITKVEADASKAEPLGLRVRGSDRKLAPHFIEEVRKFLVDSFGREQAYGGGLNVYTTLDQRMQRIAENALRDGLYELSMRQRLRPASYNVLDEGGSLDEYSHPEWENPLAEGEFTHALVIEVAQKEAKLRIGEQEIKINAQAFPVPTATREQRNDLTKALHPGDVFPVRIDKLKEVKASEEGEPSRLEITAVKLTQEPETEAALIALEVESGRVLAMVGGSDFNKSQFNKAVQAPRQTGSAFKPIVLAAALDSGAVTLGTTIFDEPTVFDDPRDPELYAPENYKREYIGITTVRDLIEKSRNIPAVKLMVHTGIDKTIETAKKMGIDAQLHPYYSVALGSIEMTLIDITGVYSVFPNQGVVVEPYFISRVEDRNGELVYEHTRRPRTAISRTSAFLAIQALLGVIERGTGKTALPIELELGVPLAGKTGTTDDYTNAWFLGFSPQVVCGVWVGNEEGTTTIGDDETGARAALPIWRRFMAEALEPEEWRTVKDYPIPPNVIAIETDHRNGKLASEFTPIEERIFEFYIRGTEPRTWTTFDDDFNLRIGSVRLMEKRVDILFENHPVVKPRDLFYSTQ